jgi:hypothetical protein
MLPSPALRVCRRLLDRLPGVERSETPANMYLHGAQGLKARNVIRVTSYGYRSEACFPNTPFSLGT